MEMSRRASGEEDAHELAATQKKGERVRAYMCVLMCVHACVCDDAGAPALAEPCAPCGLQSPFASSPLPRRPPHLPQLAPPLIWRPLPRLLRVQWVQRYALLQNCRSLIGAAVPAPVSCQPSRLLALQTLRSYRCRSLQQLPRSTQHSQSRTEAVPPEDAVFKFVLLKASQVRCFLTKTCAEDNETLRT